MTEIKFLFRSVSCNFIEDKILKKTLCQKKTWKRNWCTHALLVAWFIRTSIEIASSLQVLWHRLLPRFLHPESLIKTTLLFVKKISYPFEHTAYSFQSSPGPLFVPSFFHFSNNTIFWNFLVPIPEASLIRSVWRSNWFSRWRRLLVVLSSEMCDNGVSCSCSDLGVILT